MNKKVFIQILVVIAIVMVAVVLGMQKQPERAIEPDGNKQDNQQVENTNQITLKEARAEIERIFSDDSIDISDWPTFTNTKYGWSIKYHPDAEWQPNSMTETVEEASGPSAYLNARRIIRIDSESSAGGSNFREYSGDLHGYDLALRQIEPQSNIGFVNFKTLEFIAISDKSGTRAIINLSQLETQPLRDQLIKSLSTFKFLNE